jgi:hypothetical protein
MEEGVIRELAIQIEVIYKSRNVQSPVATFGIIYLQMDRTWAI